MKYASRTIVSEERSRAEIEQILVRYGASHFGYLREPLKFMIAFEVTGRRIRFVIPMPDRDALRRVKHGKGTKKRTDSQLESAYQKESRQRWRALVLMVKAKLEAVDAKISTFEDEFLPYTVLPDNRTVSEWLQPQLEAVHATGKMPLLLESGQ